MLIKQWNVLIHKKKKIQVDRSLRYFAVQKKSIFTNVSSVYVYVLCVLCVVILCTVQYTNI